MPVATIFKIANSTHKKYSEQTTIGQITFPQGKEDGYLVLDQLKKQYHQFSALPKFTHDLLKLRPSFQRQLIVQQPVTYTYTKSKQWFIQPNPTYVDKNMIANGELTKLKKIEDGFGLVAWYIHPGLLDRYLPIDKSMKPEAIVNAQMEAITNKFNLTPQDLTLVRKKDVEITTQHERERKDSILQMLRTGTEEERGEINKTLKKPLTRSESYSSLFTRTLSQVSLSELEKEKLTSESKQLPGKKTPYLASVLDLTHEHLPDLIALREDTLNHLKENFGINTDSTLQDPPEVNQDRVKLYFHFPYNDSTVTLHLHARVNQGTQPVEHGQEIQLDDVIKHLTTHDNIYDMILDNSPLLVTAIYRPIQAVAAQNPLLKCEEGLLNHTHHFPQKTVEFCPEAKDTLANQMLIHKIYGEIYTQLITDTMDSSVVNRGQIIDDKLDEVVKKTNDAYQAMIKKPHFPQQLDALNKSYDDIKQSIQDHIEITFNKLTKPQETPKANSKYVIAKDMITHIDAQVAGLVSSSGFTDFSALPVDEKNKLLEGFTKDIFNKHLIQVMEDDIRLVIDEQLQTKLKAASPRVK